MRNLLACSNLCRPKYQIAFSWKGSYMQHVHDLIENIQNYLSLEYTDNTQSNQYAWWLLEFLTGLDKAHLIEQSSIELSKDQETTLKNWLRKLIDEHMPLQYLFGTVPFNGVEILIKPPVLIPRPETEEWTINMCSQLQKLDNKKLFILDLCTGSGCIAIALAKYLPHATLYASDIASEAIECTKENVVHNKTYNVTVIESDLFKSIPESLKFDIIVGNPPYIAEDEWSTLELSVKNWEDKRALVASDKGLGIIKKIIKEAPAYLKPSHELEERNIPQLILEIDSTQAHKIKEYMLQEGYCDVQINKDLEGKDRTVSARVVPCGYLNR